MTGHNPSARERLLAALDRAEQENELLAAPDNSMVVQMADLRELLRISPAMEGWQDIATAPKDGSQFLGYAKGFLYDEQGPDEDWIPDRILVAEWRLHAFRDAQSGNALEFTHWMPLPPSPKGMR